MAESQNLSDNSSTDQTRLNIFEQLDTPGEASGHLESIQSAIKSLTESMSEIRAEVSSLKRPADKECSGDKTPKIRCTGSESDSDTESVTNFFVNEECSDNDEDDEFCLMDFFEDDCETGKAIDDQLAVLCNKALRAQPKENKIKEVLDKYKRPSNVENMQVPTVNEHLWRQLQPKVKAQDFLLQKSQRHYAAALVPVLKAMEHVKSEGNPNLKELLGDTFKILSNAIIATSKLRREKIKKELLPVYRPLCNAEPSATQLFGDKMEDELKKIKETKQILTSKKPFLGKRLGFQAQGHQQRKQQMFSSSSSQYGPRYQRHLQTTYRPKAKKNKFQQKGQKH